MKKIIVTLLLIAFCAIFITGCSNIKYNEQDFIGKTSLQVEAQYGKFDNIRAPADDSGLYKNCRCGYLVAKEKKGLFGSPAQFYMISFDENGVAYKAEIQNGIIGG